MSLLKPKAPRIRRNGPPTYQVFKTTIDDLGKNFTEMEQNEFHDRVKLTKRSHFNNLKGRSEAVWPPQLESALIEGLAHYMQQFGERPFGKKYLNRNTYISSYILDKTNRLRTIKQVSSRLQQVKRTTTDPDVQKLLHGRGCPPAFDIKPLTSLRPLITTTDSPNEQVSQLPISIKPCTARYPPPLPEISLRPAQPQNIHLRALSKKWHPRGPTLDPTVVLLSPIPLALYSDVKVSRGEECCWISKSPLLPAGIRDGLWRYQTCIAADFWQEISADINSDAEQHTQWTIVQHLFGDDGAGGFNNPFAELVFNFEVPSVADTTPDMGLKPSCSYYNPPESRHFPPGAGVFSPSGTYYAGSILRAATKPHRAHSMSAVDVYSRTGTFEQGSIVCTADPQSLDSCSRTGVECNKWDASDVAGHARSQSEPPFSSLADWDKLAVEFNGLRKDSCGVTGSNSTHPPAALHYFYSNTAYFNGRHALELKSGPQQTCLAIRNGCDKLEIEPNIEELTRPAAVYSITGECMGQYHIHDY